MALIKKITLISSVISNEWNDSTRQSDWKNKRGTEFLCYDEVKRFFDLPIRIVQIDLCVYDRKVKNSYKVKKDGIRRVKVNGQWGVTVLPASLRWLPDEGGYVTVEYDA